MSNIDALLRRLLLTQARQEKILSETKSQIAELEALARGAVKSVK